MVSILFFFTLRCAIWIGLWVMLAIAGKKKAKAWRLSIYAGMAFNGVAAFGHLRPDLVPHANAIGVTGNAIVIIGVAISYFFAIPTEIVKEKRTLAKEIGIIFAVASILALVTIVKRDDEVQGLKSTVSKINQKVDTIETQTSRADSISRLKPIERP